MQGAPPTGIWRGKPIGNALRELDRFLNILGDEAARLLCLPITRGQHNTANKLHGIAALGLCRADHARLRALGRSRERLYHCNGRLTDDDQSESWMLAAGRPREAHGELAPMADGRIIVVTADDLAAIAAFYRRLAMMLRDAVIGATMTGGDKAALAAAHDLSSRCAMTAA